MGWTGRAKRTSRSAHGARAAIVDAAHAAIFTQRTRGGFPGPVGAGAQRHKLPPGGEHDDRKAVRPKSRTTEKLYDRKAVHVRPKSRTTKKPYDRKAVHVGTTEKPYGRKAVHDDRKAWLGTTEKLYDRKADNRKAVEPKSRCLPHPAVRVKRIKISRS